LVAGGGKRVQRPLGRNSASDLALESFVDLA
jgi:hypothetical protein